MQLKTSLTLLLLFVTVDIKLLLINSDLSEEGGYFNFLYFYEKDRSG